MARDADMVEIIHPGAAKCPIRSRKPRRLDDMGLNPQAGAEAQNGPGIRRDIGLVKGKAHPIHPNRQWKPRESAAAEREMRPLFTPGPADLRLVGKGANRTPPGCVAPSSLGRLRRGSFTAAGAFDPAVPA
jgi:hypothetical protein